MKARTAGEIETAVAAADVASYWSPVTVSNMRQVWKEFGHEIEVGAMLDAIETLLADRARLIVELEETRSNVAVALAGLGLWTRRLSDLTGVVVG